MKTIIPASPCIAITTGGPGPAPAIKPDLELGPNLDLGIETVRGASREAVSWLRHAAWPTWLEHGVDWNRRGFHEALDFATLACPGLRRLRVAARQVFVFAKAARARLRWSPFLGQVVKPGSPL